MKKFLPKTSANRQGFTLVELLVVIAIIAILAVIGAAVFSGLQRNARDARRKSDISSIAKALDVAKSSTALTYSPLAGTMFASGSVPVDPSSARSYCMSWSFTSANAFLATPANWTATCAAGSQTASSSAWTSTLDSNPPVSTAYGVRVCASLEDTAASPNVVCSTTQQ